MNTRPLVVDLDGTLIHTDLLCESTLVILREAPMSLFTLPLTLLRGRAALKEHLASRSQLSPAALPYNQELLAWLRQEHEQGRQLVLCTASDQRYARAVADHLGFFDEVMASDGSRNLKGAAKADALRQRFGQGGFDYVGNSRADLPSWECAQESIVVSASDGLVRSARECANVTRTFSGPAPGAGDWLAAMRVQQWLKNLLLFAPALAAHRIAEPGVLFTLALALIAFSLVASATYLLNDLLDLESDRRHPRKCNRPLASGVLPVPLGAAGFLVMLVSGLALSALVGGSFLVVVLCYLALTCCYSLYLKRLVLLDCFTLTMLYTLRIIAGAAAIDMGVSFWLLAFSVFLFLSLAFVKRYAEIEVQLLQGQEKLHGRGYVTRDAAMVQALGIGAGFAAALVLSLYLNSAQIQLLYASPQIIWGAVVVLLYWVSWMWLQAHRGLMHDDPLVFAVKDGTSLACGLMFLLVLLAGTVSWSW